MGLLTCSGFEFVSNETILTCMSLGVWTEVEETGEDVMTTVGLIDPDRAAVMGAAGRRWAVEHWQWRRQADRLARLL